MLTLNDVIDFKLEKRKIILPKPENNKGNLIFLPYLKSTDVINAIKKSSNILLRQNYWRNIYQNNFYSYKLFNKKYSYNATRQRESDYDEYEENDKTIKGVKNLTLVKNKNCYIDLSQFMTNFFSFTSKPWRIVIHEFFNLLKINIEDEKYNYFNSKIILINTLQWKVDIKDTIRKNNTLNNPIAILYLAMRKEPELFNEIKNVIFVITDGSTGFFKFNTDNIKKDSYLDFKLSLSKIKSDLIDKDLDNDAHLNTYGSTSSNASKEELEKSKQENLNSEKENFSQEDENKKSLMDRLADMKASSRIQDDGYEMDDEEYNEDDEDSSENYDEDHTKSKDESKEEKDSDKELEDEILDELNTDEDTEKAVKEILTKKVPDKPVSAREKKLKEEQLNLKLSSGKTLKEVLYDVKNNPSYMNITTDDVSKEVTTLNEAATKIKYPNFEKDYNEKVFERDLYSVFNNLSNKKELPVYIRKVTKTDTSDSLNLKETYKFELEDTEYGRRHTFTIDVPKFIENKFMYIGGNKKIFVKQLILKPIVKIAPDTVQICSNYNKIFMYRYGDNSSPGLQNLIRLINTSPLFKVKKGNAVPFNTDYKTSIEYDILAKSFLEIRIKNSKTVFYFSQKEVTKFIIDNNLEEVLKKKGIDREKSLIIGITPNGKDSEFIIIDTDDSAAASVGFNNGDDVDPTNDNSNNNIIDIIINRVSLANKDFDINKAYDEIGTKIGKRYIYSRCKIMKKFVPTSLLLAYCEGLTELLKKAKVNYTFQENRPRFTTNEEKLAKGVIPFANGYLIFDRYPIQNSLLMNSFTMVDTKAYNFEDMDVKGTYLDILGNIYDSRILASAFDSFYDNMIDPITREILDSMNYPTEFTPLLLMANLLLSDNNYTSEINMNNFRVRSNEMVNAMLYKIVANAYSKYKRTASNKSPIKISVPPSALIKEIVTSQSVEDYSILNPIVETEKSRAVTCKGPSGINLDESYTEEKRSFDHTMTGLTAMSTSPDGNCGVVRALTTDPKIVSPRGFIDTSIKDEDLKDVNLFSAAEMLTPMGVTRDDSIRTSMATKQSKHIIPVAKMDSVLMSNGFEKTLPYHLTSDFTIVAKHDGVVEKIDEKNNLMVVKYKWKENGKDKTQYQLVNLSDQVSKNGAGGFFVTNTLKPYFTKGQKFKAKQVIAANKNFFNNYNDGVKFNIGTLCKVACMSGYNTFEDSTIITTRLSHKMASDITMEKHLILGKNANVLKMVKKGDKIDVNDVLIEFDQSNEEEGINKLLANITDDLKDEISSLSKGKIVSKYSGYISDVKIYCVSELEELSPSLNKLVSDYWKDVKDKKKYISQYNIEDPSLTGNLYTYDDKPIKPLNGKVKGFDIEDGVLIFIYITYHNPFSIGDKLVNFSALKGVCTEIIPLGDEFYSEFRPKEEISSFFPPGGTLARMVPSSLVTMFGNKVIIELKRKLGDMYLGHYDYSQDFDGHIDGVPDSVRKI